jgi:hypothetical protein
MDGGRTGPVNAIESGAGATAPLKTRLAILAGVATILAGALYLIAVRGEALLLDLSTLAGRVWCF